VDRYFWINPFPFGFPFLPPRRIVSRRIYITYIAVCLGETRESHVQEIHVHLGDRDEASNLCMIHSIFMEEGRNGVHLCLVYPFAGPSVLCRTLQEGYLGASDSALIWPGKCRSKPLEPWISFMPQGLFMEVRLILAFKSFTPLTYDEFIHYVVDLTTSNILFGPVLSRMSGDPW